jgi:hypothetical protein
MPEQRHRTDRGLDPSVCTLLYQLQSAVFIFNFSPKHLREIYMSISMEGWKYILRRIGIRLKMYRGS